MIANAVMHFFSCLEYTNKIWLHWDNLSIGGNICRPIFLNFFLNYLSKYWEDPDNGNEGCHCLWWEANHLRVKEYQVE